MTEPDEPALILQRAVNNWAERLKAEEAAKQAEKDSEDQELRNWTRAFFNAAKETP